MIITRKLALAASLGLALGLSATGAHAQAAQSDTVVVTRVEPAPQDAGLARRSAATMSSTAMNFALEIFLPAASNRGAWNTTCSFCQSPGALAAFVSGALPM